MDFDVPELYFKCAGLEYYLTTYVLILQFYLMFCSIRNKIELVWNNGLENKKKLKLLTCIYLKNNLN